MNLEYLAAFVDSIVEVTFLDHAESGEGPPTCTVYGVACHTGETWDIPWIVVKGWGTSIDPDCNDMRWTILGPCILTIRELA